MQDGEEETSDRVKIMGRDRTDDRMREMGLTDHFTRVSVSRIGKTLSSCSQKR